MKQAFEVGKFDLDIALRDAALDEANRPTRRMLANACIAVESYDAYYSARELIEALEAMHEGKAGAKAKLAEVLSNACDDFQRCLYYCVAGRGVVQMLDDLAWLSDMLEARTVLSAELMRNNTPPMIQINPYVAPEPDGPVPSRDAEFVEGASWYLDPQLGGEIAD